MAAKLMADTRAIIALVVNIMVAALKEESNAIALAFEKDHMRKESSEITCKAANLKSDSLMAAEY
jgi:hypothetical protein